MKFEIMFEFYGRKMKTTVDAVNALEARNKVADRLIIHKISADQTEYLKDKAAKDFGKKFSEYFK